MAQNVFGLILALTSYLDNDFDLECILFEIDLDREAIFFDFRSIYKELNSYAISIYTSVPSSS